MLILRWDDFAEPVKDNKALGHVRTAHFLSTHADDEFVLRISNELLITAAKVLIARGEIPHDQVILRLNDTDYPFNEYAAIYPFPDDYPMLSCEWSEEVLRAASVKWKAERLARSQQ